MGGTFRGSSPGGERDFPHRSVPAVGPIQSPVQWVPISFQGLKRPGPGVDHPLSSSPDVKDGVELFFSYPTGLSWPVLRGNLPLFISEVRAFV